MYNFVNILFLFPMFLGIMSSCIMLILGTMAPKQKKSEIRAL